MKADIVFSAKINKVREKKVSGNEKSAIAFSGV